MQIEDFKAKQFDLNFSMTKDTNILTGSEARKDIELEMAKKRNVELEYIIKDLKEELHGTKVEKEKIHERYEQTIEENRTLKEQISSLRKLMLELERKGISTAGILKSIEKPELRTSFENPVAGKPTVSQVFPLTSQSNPSNDQTNRSIRATIEDNRPIKGGARNLPKAAEVEDRINRIMNDYGKSTTTREANNRRTSPSQPHPQEHIPQSILFVHNPNDDRPIRSAASQGNFHDRKSLEPHSRGYSSSGGQNSSQTSRPMQAPQATLTTSNILTWDNPYKGSLGC